MAIASTLRFRLILGAVKHIIFAVDKSGLDPNLFDRSRGSQPLEVPDVGEPLDLPCGAHTLAAWWVTPEVRAHAAVLLLHGIGDQLHYWRRVQQHLAEAGVASLVVAYSGYPGSGGWASPAQMDRDAHAAYAGLRARIAPSTPVFLMGFSLGTGLAAWVAPQLTPSPDGVILAQAYTSLRLGARSLAGPLGFLAPLLPDHWRTHETVARLTVPLLVVHATGDSLFPPTMAEEVFAAARAVGVEAELRLVPGYSHGAPFRSVPPEYWSVVVEFLRRGG